MANPNVVRDMGETLMLVLKVALSGMVAPANVRVATPDIFHELKPTPQPTCTIFSLSRRGQSGDTRSEPGGQRAKASRTGRCSPVDLSVFDNALGQGPAR